MRALFRPFALHAAYTPIETIVFFCIIGTLAYFHILSAIKHSTFLDPSSSSSNRLTWRPAHALFQSGEWVAVREGKWNYGLKNAGRNAQQLVEVQQLVFGAETADEQTSSSLLSSSVLNLTDYLTGGKYRTATGHSYPELCYRIASTANHSERLKAECFTMQQASSRGAIQTLAFKASKRDEYTKSLLSTEQPGSTHKQPRTFQDENGLQFIVIPEGGLASSGDAGGNFWFAYAARALVVRFWDLAKKADSLDILLILAGYILMHTTFYLLLVRSRQIGSSFWLPLAIMSAAVLSLLLALPIAMAIKIPIDPVALTEALPFLVCTVGFDKPLRLARAVFMHPHLSTPVRPGAGSGYPAGALDGVALSTNTNTNTNSTTNASGTNACGLLAPPQSPTPSAPSSAAGQMKPAPKIITESLTHVYPPIIRDYVLEIAVLTVGAYSKVGGLAEVCALAALVLAVDCLLLCTYLAAILGIMVEVRRIKTVRAYTRSRSNSVASSVKSAPNGTGNGGRLQSVMARPTVADLASTSKNTTLRQRVKSLVLGEKGSVKSLVLGEKGSGLPEFERGYGGRGQKMVRAKGKKGGKAGNENPVARLKLLLIATFMTLHTLNLITPLTPSRHNYSSAASALGAGIDGQVNVRKVDITAPAVRSVLVALQIQMQEDHDLGEDEDDEASASSSILVKVHPPIHIRAFSAKSAAAAAAGGKAPHASLLSAPFTPSPAFMHAQGLIAQHKRSTSEHVDAFMSAWTRLVGDPILSKWIVILLAISVVLNGYLLKGIAAGVVGAGVGTFRAFSVRGAVRFEEEEEGGGVGGGLVPVQEREGERKKGNGKEEKEKEKLEESGSEALSLTPKGVPVVAPAPPVPSVAAPALVQPPAVPVGTFTLEDVDRRLEQARANSRRMTVTASSASASTSTTATSISASSISSDIGSSASSATSASAETRPLSEVLDIFEHGSRPLAASLALLTDEEVIMLVQEGRIQPYGLEKALGMDLPNLERAVKVRRAVISRASRTKTLEDSDIPLTQYDYSRVYGACCENVVGYIPLPLGIAGPLTIDGQPYLIPMATAEGTLVASTSRGCKALNAGGGVSTVLLRDAMTRGPAVGFDNIQEAARCARWIESVEGSDILRRAFESTSRFAKLVGGSASGVDSSNNGGGLKTALAGRTLYIRFRTTTGDAMGMNMISKGTEKALAALQEEFPTARILALSGNYCTDKKAAAINWIEGRGKSIVAECVVPGAVVEKVLKTTVRGIVELNIKKNLIGSAMASVVGGYNAHAANIVAAVFLATGQDPAQVVESSMCLTGMEAVNNDRDLLVTITMPSIEVGTVGGGTVLAPQGGVLSLLGIKGAHPTHPGQNAQQLARIVASAVMAGELSLMSALAAGDLIRAHMTHNRSVVSTPAAGVAPAGEGHGVLVDPAAPVKVLPITPSSSTTPLPVA